MKVLALASDHGGCAFYRIEEPARVTRRLGVDITVSRNLDVAAETDPKTGVTTVHEIHTDADVIVFQRPLNNAFASAIRQAKRQGIATVVELDDDFDTLHSHNYAAHAMKYAKGESPEWLRTAASEADLVTVSTPALMKYARPHDRGVVLRNCVPRSIFDITPAYERDHAEVRLGWSGTVQTHPTDLQETRGAMRDLKPSLYIVGDGEMVRRNLSLPMGTPMEATGWVDRKDYFEAMTGMDVGIVPLELSPFNQAKSALKGIEMAALGIPFVASPTREYERAEVYGLGSTATGPGAWRKKVGQLLSDDRRRLKLAKQYREIVYNGMVYEDAALGWVEAWEAAIQFRKAHP